MKRTFATVATVILTLCATSAALAETPAPTPIDAPQIAVPDRAPNFVAKMESWAPWIRQLLDSYTAVEGDTVIFKLEYGGDPMPTVIVYVDEQKLDVNKDPGRYRLYCKDGYFRLTIYNVKLEDAGKYTFRVENQAGTAETSTCLKVKEYD